MKRSALDILIPAPQHVERTEGLFPLRQLTAIHADVSAISSVDELRRGFACLRLPLTVAASPTEAQLCLAETANLFPEAWRVTITPMCVTLEAGGSTGFRYASGALLQMAFFAAMRGTENAVLECGIVEDAPRFAYRGFLLDSARHFQSSDAIKQLLRLLATFRVNRFHWHLVDNEGWRLPSNIASKAAGCGAAEPGGYSREDLKEITALAMELGIQVIPEIDVPGHSKLLLDAYPEFTCDPNAGAAEFCLGKPECLEFLKALIDEVMELFPDSPVIHLGGDEAETAAWDACPVCQNTLKEKNLKTARELENDFMAQLCRHVIACGRRPMLWGTSSGQVYPSETIIQAWLDIRESLAVAQHGNQVVYSVHNSLYLDYPANASEPQENWMFALPEEGVYMTEPYVLWEDKLKDVILGTETCLWTELVPQWRILAKVMPRLPAYAECAWSLPAKKDFHDFITRKDLLEAAGWFDFITCL